MKSESWVLCEALGLLLAMTAFPIAARQTSAPPPAAQAKPGAVAPAAVAPGAAGQAPPVQIALQRVRVSRVMVYNNGAGLPSHIEGSDAAQQFTDRWQSGCEIEFLVTPPPGTQIVSLDDATLLHGTVVGNRSVVMPAPAAPPGAPPAHISPDDLDESDAHDVIRLHCLAPPREASSIMDLQARFTMTLGQRRSAAAARIAAQAGRQLLARELPPDVTLTLDRVTSDAVMLRVRGRIDRLGEIEFANFGGEPVRAYGTDITHADMTQPVERREELRRYMFAEVPADIGLSVTYYDNVQKITIPLRIASVQLP